MKHLIIILIVSLLSIPALASTGQPADCDFLTGNVFVCYFDGTTGLELFENSDALEIARQEKAEDGSLMTDVLAPSLIGYDLDIKNCISETFSGEAIATCFLNQEEDLSGFSTARPVPQNTTILRPVPQKTVIKRVDRR